MQKIFVIIIYIFSYMPFVILRLISLKIRIFNKLFFRYRYQVVLTNLRLAFPDKKEVEIRKIRRQFYRYFFNLIIQIIKSLTVKKSFIDKRVEILNPEVIDNLLLNYPSVILLSGHYNNWEWMGAKISLSYNQPFVAVYKKLSSPSFNKLISQARSRFGSTLINMDKSIRYIIKHKDKSKIIGMIADQNPIVNESTSWLPFFEKEGPVFIGAEKIAKKLGYPVLFCNMKKTGNNNYSITFEIISEDSNNIKEGEITKTYFNLLEKQIKNEPSQWLWSHRRWKHRK